MAEARAFREQPEISAALPAVATPLRIADFRDVVSDAGYDFIVKWETGGEAYYMTVIKGRPIWPGFSSGITIGCGYDLGYHKAAEFEDDWSGRIPLAAIRRLSEMIGFKTVEPDRASKVEHAKQLVQLLSDIVVAWPVAVAQFDAKKMPKLVALMDRSLPNVDRLHPHCYGALLSLIFNRGTPFRDPAPRYAEMVDIRKRMEGGTVEAFAKIPALLRSMERIWGAGSSLAKRRHGEAELFERGLQEMEIVRSSRPAPAPRRATSPSAMAAGPSAMPAGEATRASEQHESLAINQSDSPDTETLELPRLSMSALAVFTPDNVAWNTKDDEQPDYRHLDTRQAGTIYELRPADFDLLIASNHFQVPVATNPLVIFALRGAKLIGAATRKEKEAVVLQDQRPDHRSFRCVIGVYDRVRQLLTAFQASTVPNAKYVHKCYLDSQGGVPLDGVTGNILPTGCYVYTVGTHKPGQKGEIRGALRLSKTAGGADQVVVLRSVSDVTYDRMDRWHRCAPADNIHPGQNTIGFSSAGCLTLPGFYGEGTHSGAWADFRSALGLGSGGSDDGKQFRCLLLTGLDAAVAAGLREENAADDPERVKENLVRLRHGSQGPAVQRLQAALGLAPDTSQVMGPVTREALVRLQGQKLGWADGILSPEVERQLQLNVLTG